MPTETALALMIERKIEICECCETRPAEEAHHCLYRRDRSNKKAEKVLNEKYNLQLVCKECHAGKAKTYENKMRFWHLQVERYGIGTMLSWHDRVPYKVKEFGYRY